MNFPKNLLFCGILLLMFFTSCISKQALLNKNYEKRTIAIHGKLLEIEFVDERLEVSDRPIKIPIITVPGQTDKVFPVLTDTLKDVLISQINSYFVADDRAFKVKCTIREGYQKFSASALSESEFVYVETSLVLYDEEGEVLQNCDSNAGFEKKSMDASNRYLEKLYEKALRLAVYKCFEKMTKGA